ncbi:MAG: homocysteine S-methyltransferase family protein [Pseudomonadota bacterium]
MTDVTLLDGGMGQELIHRSEGPPTALWSARVMLENPGLVADIHRDFAQAGAGVSTTNSYAIHRDRLDGTGLESRFKDLHAMALEEVKDGAPGTVIAGSIGPLVASYRPDLHPDYDTAVRLYTEIAELLAETCQILICETVVSIEHAKSILAAAKSTGLPVWIAFCTAEEDGTVLRSGERLEEALPIAEASADAILINCTAPEAIPAGLDILAKGERPIGAYANAFETISEGFLTPKPTVDALKTRADLTPDTYAEHALKWVDCGASIVGGCCEVSPSHIAAIATKLRDAGHTLTQGIN